jgi:hypothetical protein
LSTILSSLKFPLNFQKAGEAALSGMKDTENTHDTGTGENLDRDRTFVPN